MLKKIGQLVESFGPWFLSHGVRIVVILIGGFLIYRLGGRIIEKLVRRAVKGNRFSTSEAEKKREDTLINVFVFILKLSIWAVLVLSILSEIGFDIGPFLAGAGIVGIALGFGAQYVVRDFLAGIFIILENQYRIGDVICVGNICGTVEDINLRVTILRDAEGAVHHIPNGEIKIATNKSKEFARINLKVGVAYDAELEKVIEVANRVGKELAEDAAWKDKILKAPEFVRVDDFADSAVIIRISGEVKPLEQWNVLGELRKRLKIAFDKEGIEIPFPQLVVRQPK